MIYFLRKLIGSVMVSFGMLTIIAIPFSAPDTAPTRLLLNNLPFYVVAIAMVLVGYVMYQWEKGDAA